MPDIKPTQNGSAPNATPRSIKEVPDGIYVPTVTFFQPTTQQELDLDTYAAHIRWMAASGIAGVTVQGSTGEAATLSREERKTLCKVTREALDTVSNSLVVVVGTVGAQSTAQAIEFAKDGAESGADFALVLPPAYYASTLDPNAVVEFFSDVASASPIPVLVYSYPGVTSGLVMTSDTIGRIAQHPNVVGVKTTCHDIGKGARLVALSDELETSFKVLGGASDYLVPSLSVGSAGCITGMGNIAPRLVVRVYNLWKEGKVKEAMELQKVVSKGEWPLGKGQINGVKYAVAYWNKLEPTAAVCRKPTPAASETVRSWVETECKQAVEMERRLEKEAGYSRHD